MFSICLTLVLACTPTALLDFVIPKWKVDKDIRMEDAYKHLYQATRGGEHAAPSRESAKKWLDTEWQSLTGPIKGEMWWEPLCPDGEVVRVNLRPFKELGATSDDILDAFLASASEYKSEPKAFTEVWAELGEQLKKKKIGKLDRASWDNLNTKMKERNYPAVHHSEHYNKARRPAYRILTSQRTRQLSALYHPN